MALADDNGGPINTGGHTSCSAVVYVFEGRDILY